MTRLQSKYEQKRNIKYSVKWDKELVATLFYSLDKSYQNILDEYFGKTFFTITIIYLSRYIENMVSIKNDFEGLFPSLNDIILIASVMGIKMWNDIMPSFSSLFGDVLLWTEHRFLLSELDFLCIINYHLMISKKEFKNMYRLLFGSRKKNLNTHDGKKSLIYH